MTVFLRLLGGLSLFLLTCMLICGLWVRFHPQQDMGFHFLLGLAAVGSAMVAITLSSLPRADAGAFPTKKTAAGGSFQ